MKWYVAKVKWKMENTALHNIEDQGFQTYLPIMGEMTKLGWKVKPMFPGFLFVQFDIRQNAWRKISNTRGVSRLLCMDEETPSAVPDGWVEMMMSEQEIRVTPKFSQGFIAGDRLELLEGPFKGHVGICQLSNRKRVRLLLNLFGSTVAVDSPHLGVRRATQ